MISVEAGGNAARAQDKYREGQEASKEPYGFKVSFVDDNSVHVKDATGHEVAFAFPLNNTSLEEYDRFIEQMMDTVGAPPSIELIKLVIMKPLSMASRSITEGNSPTYSHTWEQHAENFGITTDEMKAMYFFAREKLYARLRDRLRRQSV